MRELPSDRLRAQVPLSAYVKSRFPDLKMTGGHGHFRCACPIHGSSNSSTFSIDDQKGYWTCFSGCGSGSVIDFWLKINSRPSSDALVAMEQIAADMRVDIGLSDQSERDTLSSRDLHNVVKAVCDAAHKRLMESSSAASAEALDYLYDRGLDDDDLESWNLGFFPDRKSIVKWMTAVAREVVGKKSKEALIATQLLEQSQYADETYSQFAERIVFPIRDESDNYVAVSCRILPSQQNDKKKDGKPKSKYINSRNTVIFNKSSVLFGEHRAVSYGKKKTSTVFVCEGQMDVISLSWVLADDEIAVATCGTALTEDHMDWLARFKHTALMFDNDKAGRKALVKATSIVNFSGSKNVTSITLNSGKDANEIASADEQQLIDDIARGTRPLLHDVAEAMWLDAEESPTALLAATREVSERITRSVERQRLIDALDEATGIPAEKISRELSMSITTNAPSKGSKNRGKERENLSNSLVPLAAWLASLDTLTRQTLLLDMEEWLKSDHVCSDLLGASTETDKAVMTYLAIGSNMSDNYTDSQIEQSVSILTDLVSSNNNVPHDHFVRIARVLIDDMKRKLVGKHHLKFLLSVTNRSSGMDDDQLFNSLGEIINEVC